MCITNCSCYVEKRYCIMHLLNVTHAIFWPQIFPPTMKIVVFFVHLSWQLVNIYLILTNTRWNHQTQKMALECIVWEAFLLCKWKCGKMAYSTAIPLQHVSICPTPAIDAKKFDKLLLKRCWQWNLARFLLKIMSIKGVKKSFLPDIISFLHPIFRQLCTRTFDVMTHSGKLWNT